MKKNLLVFTLIILAVNIISAQSTRFGFSGGPVAATMFEKVSGVKHVHDYRIGETIGIFLDVPMEKHGSFQPGLNIVVKRSKDVFTEAGKEVLEKVSITYIELPLNVVFRVFPGSKGNVLLGGGIAPAMAKKGKITNEVDKVLTVDRGLNFGDETSDDYGKFDFGLNALAGYEFKNGFSIVANYNHGIKRLFVGGNPDDKLYNRYFALRFGYLIGKKKAKEPVAVVIPPPTPQPPVDSDGDGVPDSRDRCPNQSGVAEYQGCPVPDTDGDGINDKSDKCPNQKGTAEYQGCPIPDSDGDGFNDKEDKCPNQAGVAKYNGCPIPDRDGDGINDESDKCPNVAGPADNFGCPVIGIRSYEVVFKPGSAVLLPRGKFVLDTVVAYLKKNTEVSITVDGHTDNTGSDKINDPLSVKRAEASKAYIVSKGIDADRMTTAGFGSKQPIADNKTADGRKKNRRIEIKIKE